MGEMQQPWLFVCTPDQKQQSAIGAQILAVGGQGSFCPPWFPQAMFKMLQEEHVYSCLLCGQRWGTGSYYCAESWNWSKSTSICPTKSPLWKLQAFSTLQSSRMVTSDRFRQCNCYLGGEADSWCFLLCHCPRILPHVYSLIDYLLDKL